MRILTNNITSVVLQVGFGKNKNVRKFYPLWIERLASINSQTKKNAIEVGILTDMLKTPTLISPINGTIMAELVPNKMSCC